MNTRLCQTSAAIELLCNINRSSFVDTTKMQRDRPFTLKNWRSQASFKFLEVSFNTILTQSETNKSLKEGNRHLAA